MTFWIHLAVHVVRALTKERETKPAIPLRRRAAPAATTPRDAVLHLEAHGEPMEGARCVRLAAADGEAWLVLCDPPPDADGDAALDAILEARDPAKGAAFVNAVAAWLGVAAPPPPRAAAGPAPFGLHWRRLGGSADAERISLAFAHRGRCAEVLVDLRGSSPSAQLVEKDPATRGDLVAILATALRDGPTA